MKIFALVSSFSLSCYFAALGYSQVLPFSGNRELALSRTDVRTTPVAAGSKTSVTFTADPSSGGGDVFDIRVDNPFLAISLILPGGAEVTSSNAATLGFNYTVFGVSGASPLDPSVLGAPGTHTLITLPASQPPGVYTVVADATSLAADSALIGAYLSSSNVAAGVTSDAAVYRTGDTVVISALLSDDAQPVTSVPSKACKRSLSPSLILTWTRSVSPGRKVVETSVRLFFQSKLSQQRVLHEIPWKLLSYNREVPRPFWRAFGFGPEGAARAAG